MHHALSCAARKLKCNSSNAIVIQRDFPGLHFRKKTRHKNLRDDYQNSMRNLSHLRLQAMYQGTSEKLYKCKEYERPFISPQCFMKHVNNSKWRETVRMSAIWGSLQ